MESKVTRACKEIAHKDVIFCSSCSYFVAKMLLAEKARYLTTNILGTVLTIGGVTKISVRCFLGLIFHCFLVRSAGQLMVVKLSFPMFRVFSISLFTITE